jgi:hypothetical protein
LPSLVNVSKYLCKRLQHHLHSGIENPFQVFLALFWSTMTRLDSAEKLGVPIYALTITLCRLFSLSFLHLCFGIRGNVLVSSLDSFGDIMPKFLRLPLVLFLQGSSQWGAVLGV